MYKYSVQWYSVVQWTLATSIQVHVQQTLYTITSTCDVGPGPTQAANPRYATVS